MVTNAFKTTTRIAQHTQMHSYCGWLHQLLSWMMQAFLQFLHSAILATPQPSRLCQISEQLLAAKLQLQYCNKRDKRRIWSGKDWNRVKVGLEIHNPFKKLMPKKCRAWVSFWIASLTSQWNYSEPIKVAKCYFTTDGLWRSSKANKHLLRCKGLNFHKCSCW